MVQEADDSVMVELDEKPRSPVPPSLMEIIQGPLNVQCPQVTPISVQDFLNTYWKATY
jgi:hypothetical protein